MLRPARLAANPASLITATKTPTESAKRNANTGLTSTPALTIGHFAQPGNLPMAPYAPAVSISGATLDGDDCQAVADAMNEAAGQNWIGAVVPTSVVRRTAETHRAGRYRSFV